MPNYDGKGPLNTNKAGRGLGPCGQGMARGNCAAGQGRGMGGGQGRGMGGGQGRGMDGGQGRGLNSKRGV